MNRMMMMMTMNTIHFHEIDYRMSDHMNHDLQQLVPNMKRMVMAQLPDMELLLF